MLISYCHGKISLMISTYMLSTYLMSTTILSTESLVQETHAHPSSTHRNSCCCLLSTELLSTYLMSTTIISTDLLSTKLLSIHLHTHRNSFSTSLQSMQLPLTHVVVCYPQSCCQRISCPRLSYPPISCPRNSCPSIFIHIETHLLPVSNPCNSPSPISHPPNTHSQDHKTSPNTSKLIFYQSPICCEKPLRKAVVFSVLCKIIKKKLQFLF